jgi:hypothetical protein
MARDGDKLWTLCAVRAGSTQDTVDINFIVRFQGCVLWIGRVDTLGRESHTDLTG